MKRVTKIETANMLIPGIPNLYGLSKNRRACVRVKNKKIAFLGVTFKANTDDMRDSTSLKMIPYLCKKGAKVNYYDPSGEKNEFRNIKNFKVNN